MTSQKGSGCDVKTYKAVSGFFHKISNICVWIAGIVLVLIAILTFVEVIARYALNNSIVGVQEISELSIVVVLYFGLAYSTYSRSHVKVDVVINTMRPDIKMITQGIMSLLCILFSAPAAWQVAKQGSTFLLSGRSTSLMHIRYWPFYYAAAFGLALTSFEFLFDGLRWFGEARQWQLKRKEDGDSAAEEVAE